MIERLRCGFLDHSITHFVHVAILQLGAIKKIDELRPVRGHAARIGQQFLKCDFGELGIHRVLQLGKNSGERRIPSQFPFLAEFAGQQRRNALVSEPMWKRSSIPTGISCS